MDRVRFQRQNLVDPGSAYENAPAASGAFELLPVSWTRR
jgi:hypothetical protein